ncbi:MAG: mercury transporter MerT [Hyphomicrobiales bacterium]|nr:mercury transporter MerT [Hyphomicrobiales bacterium]MBV9977164.1 mercury transporter MerT [Hyphomicrobiales bacterium]
MALPDIVSIRDSASSSPSTPSATPSGLLAAGGAAFGLAAVLASSCCAIPVLLAAVGAGAGVFTALDALSSFRLPLIAFGGLGVAGGWWLHWRKGLASCKTGALCAVITRSHATTTMLCLATLMVVVATVWDFIEPALLRLMGIG